MNVWKLQQPAPSTVLSLHTPRGQDQAPPTKREKPFPHTTSSFCSGASLPSLQSSDSERALDGKHWDAESTPQWPTRHENKLRSSDQSTVCSWYVQDLQMDYESHRSSVLTTELEAQRLVPPARRLSENEVRTIPYVVSECEYLIQNQLMIRCSGDHNALQCLHQ